MTVPRLIGQKFMYSNVDRAETSKALKQALELLCSARICHRINHSAGRGVPLVAQENEKKFKVIFFWFFDKRAWNISRPWLDTETIIKGLQYFYPNCII